MNKTVRSLIIGITLLAAHRTLAAPPRYPVQPVGKAPVIDGRLDDACWARLPLVGGFVNERGQPASPASEVRVGYDREYIYLGARLLEPDMSKVQATVTKHDEGVYLDDDLEWFLSPTESGSPYFTFRINALGTTDEGRDIDPAKLWNAAWKSAVQKEAHAWTVEMAVPFAALEHAVPAETVTWRMNICRGRPRVHDFTAWANAQGAFNTAANFGEIHFLKSVVLEKVAFGVQPLAKGGRLTISVAGVPQNLSLRIFRTLDGESLKTVYDGIPIGAAGTGSKTLTFPEDGYVSSAQVDVIEEKPPRRVLYRSEGLILKETDQWTVRMNRTEKAIGELAGANLPDNLKELRTHWAERFEKLKASRDDAAGRRLYQELRFARWILGVPEPLRTQAVLWFSEIPFTEIDYDTLPDPGHLGRPVKFRALRGEYEPGCVNLISAGGDGKYLLAVQDLSGPGGAVLPAACFDQRVLKNWYQAGKAGHKNTDGSGVWVSELLLKDDSIISSDHVRQRNTIHSTRDADQMQPVPIPRFHTRQFWLTLRVPAQQKPGLYSGTVAILADGKEAGKIPIEVEVLPLSREESDFTWTMYYTQFYTGGKDPRADRWNEQDLKIMAEHGLTAVAVQEGAPEVVKDKFVTKFDYTNIRHALELRKKYGLVGRTVFAGTSWYTTSTDTAQRQTAEELLAKPYYKANWVLFAKGLAALTKEFGLKDGYIYCLDEPGYDESGARMKAEALLAKWSREGGIGGTSAITPAGARQVRGVLAVPVLDSPSGEIGAHRKKWDLPGEVWYYWHPLENPSYDRLLAGYMIWYGGFTGADPWVYKVDLAKWDDWTTCGYGLRVMNYVYPGDNGPIPTWEFEAYREGADDVIYLEMLQRRVKRLSDKKLSGQDAEALNSAKQILDAPPKKFQGTSYDLPNKLNAKDFYEFRQTVIGLLLQLDRVQN